MLRITNNLSDYGRSGRKAMIEILEALNNTLGDLSDEIYEMIYCEDEDCMFLIDMNNKKYWAENGLIEPVLKCEWCGNIDSEKSGQFTEKGCLNCGDHYYNFHHAQIEKNEKYNIQK